MIKKFAVAITALLVLSGCSHGHGKSGSVNSGVESALVADFEKNAGNAVWFGYDSSMLSHNDKVTLKKQSEWLKAHPRIMATVEGHCDERGTVEYNLALGEKRAEETKKFLMNQGVEASKLNTISYGKERPAVVAHDEAGWKQNRRAVTALRY